MLVLYARLVDLNPLNSKDALLWSEEMCRRRRVGEEEPVWQDKASGKGLLEVGIAAALTRRAQM